MTLKAGLKTNFIIIPSKINRLSYINFYNINLKNSNSLICPFKRIVRSSEDFKCEKRKKQPIKGKRKI